MKALNICVDIDGTITEPYYWIKEANKFFNTNIKEADVTKYEICEVLGISNEEYLEFYSKYGAKIHLEAQIRNNAKRVLWEMSKKHNIFYVTAREERLKEETIRWFNNHDLPTGELFLLGSPQKAQKAKELNCDIFLEDRYENAVELSKEGFQVLLLDCNYNRFKLTPGIQRVLNWDEINLIIKMEEKNMKNIA